MNELEGGRPRQAIDYNNGPADNYGGGDDQRSAKPWERGPSGGAAPWARNNRDEQDGGSNAPPPWAGAGAGASYNSGGYNAAPWAAPAAPAAPGAPAAAYGYGSYGGYDSGAPPAAPPGMNAYGVPGYGAAAAPPPGIAPWSGYGNAGSPPPPPPGGAPPPPPPPHGDAPPPPVSKSAF
jgi:splicing factor 1